MASHLEAPCDPHGNKAANAGDHWARRPPTSVKPSAASQRPPQALYKADQRHLFNRVSGGEEKAAERLALVSAALAKANPDFVAVLHRSGALHSANVVSYLADIGRVAAVRQEVQGGRSLADVAGRR